MSGVEDLVRWLRAQLDEDEQAAHAATDGPWTPWRNSTMRGLGDLLHVVLTPGQKPGAKAVIVTASWLDAEHIARHDPARVLREIDAKRQLLALHVPTPHEDEGDPWPGCSTCSWRDEMDDLRVRYPCPTVRLLALPYTGRPGYLDAWRP